MKVYVSDGGIIKFFLAYSEGLNFGWKYCMAFFSLQRRFKFWMEILQGLSWLIEKV